MEKVLFIGGDKRSVYAAEKLSASCDAAALGLPGFARPSGAYGRIVLPLPFSREEGVLNAPLSDCCLPLQLIADYADSGAVVYSGGTSPLLARLCADNGLRLVDYYASERLTLINARLTAEAAVALCIQHTDHTLLGAAVAVIGGGRIAQLLAPMLIGLGARVTLAARSGVQRARAELQGCATVGLSGLPALLSASDIVLNTVPAGLIGEMFSLFPAGALYVELASRPAAEQSAEQTLAQSFGVRCLSAGGLPGKYSPKTAGEAVARELLELFSQPDNS